MNIINPIHDSDETFAALELIASVTGNEKQRLINEACKFPKFLGVCKLALDPFITYGVKKLEFPDETTEGGVFNDDTLALLNNLADRTLTGRAAQVAITSHMLSLSESSQTLLSRIIKRDLRASFSASSINKARPGEIFVFECMLAKPFEEKRVVDWPVAVEPKFDGVRCIAIYLRGEVKFYSRSGKQFTQFDKAAASIKKAIEGFDKIPEAGDYPGTKMPVVLDGEMMTGEFNKTSGDIHRKDFQADDAIFWVFEMMSMAAFDSGNNKDQYSKRRARLEIFFRDINFDSLELAPMRQCFNAEEIATYTDEIQSKGGEGVIVKPMDGLYVKKRSFSWLKVKAEGSVDLNVVGIEPGTGKFEGKIGALVCDFDGVLVNVGSGLTDDLRDKAPDFFIHRLVEVKYHEVTPDKSLRHPRFHRFRDDKPHEDGMGAAA